MVLEVSNKAAAELNTLAQPIQRPKSVNSAAVKLFEEVKEALSEKDKIKNGFYRKAQVIYSRIIENGYTQELGDRLMFYTQRIFIDDFFDKLEDGRDEFNLGIINAEISEVDKRLQSLEGNTEDIAFNIWYNRNRKASLKNIGKESKDTGVIQNKLNIHFHLSDWVRSTIANGKFVSKDYTPSEDVVKDIKSLIPRISKCENQDWFYYRIKELINIFEFYEVPTDWIDVALKENGTSVRVAKDFFMTSTKEDIKRMKSEK